MDRCVVNNDVVFYIRKHPVTVDDDEAYCQSRTLEDLVHEMRAEIKTSCQSGPHAVVLKIFIKCFVNITFF